MLGTHTQNRFILDGCMLAIICRSFLRSTRGTRGISPSPLISLLLRDGEHISDPLILHHSRSSDGSCRFFVLYRKKSRRSSVNEMAILTSVQAALFNVVFAIICWSVIFLGIPFFFSFIRECDQDRLRSGKGLHDTPTRRRTLTI